MPLIMRRTHVLFLVRSFFLAHFLAALPAQPRAADPYAKAVIESRILNGNSGNNSANPSALLGESDGAGVSLGGPGAHVVIDMGADTPVINGTGADLEVREIGAAFGGVDEAYRVLISNSPDTNTFVLVGIGRALSLFDIQATGLETARYVWLQDLATETLNTQTPGSDIDSLRSLHFSGGAEDVDPPRNLTLRPTGQGVWLSWTPPADEEVTGYAIRRSLNGISFNSTPDATLSARETAFHDRALPATMNIVYAVSTLSSSGESVLSLVSTDPVEVPIHTNRVAHVGDNTVAAWEVQEPERQLSVTFNLEGFAEGPEAELLMDVWDADNAGTPILLNGARLGGVPTQSAEAWEARAFRFAAGALQPGVNTLVIGGEAGTLDDLQLRNIRLRVLGFRSGGAGIITGARFTEINPGQTHVTLRWVVQQTPTLSPPDWETVSQPIEWTGEVVSEDGFYRLREEP